MRTAPDHGPGRFLSVGATTFLELSTVMTMSGKKQATDLSYGDWGKPVSIVAPPSSQVGSAPGMWVEAVAQVVLTLTHAGPYSST